MPNDFSGAVVLITGASGGLGRAIACEVASRGAATVLINYSGNRAEAEETGRAVEALGTEGVLIQGNVAEDADCRRIGQEALRFGRLDALFNNAGVTKFAGDHSDLDAVDADDFLNLYRVNVVGTYQMTRAVRGLLESAPAPGAVVNTASIAGVLGNGSSVPYAASKGAMVTMTLSLARALAPKIRVNAICPGYIDTPWFGRELPEGSVEEIRRNVANSTPLKVASKPEDIAGAAVFLASPAARHITGEALMVDAGYHLGFAPLTMR